MSAVICVTLDDSLQSPLWALASLSAMWEDRTGTSIRFLYLVTVRSCEDRGGTFYPQLLFPGLAPHGS